MKQTCMCIKGCLYMWAYTCTHMCLSTSSHAGRASTVTSAKVQILRRDRFAAMICVLVRTGGTGFRTPTDAEGCPRKNISALFLAFDGKICCSAPHHFCLGSWHGVAVKIGCSPLLKRKDLCLCSPFLRTCLAGGGGSQTAQDGGEASALWSVLVLRSMPRPWRGQRRSFYSFFV